MEEVRVSACDTTYAYRRQCSGNVLSHHRNNRPIDHTSCKSYENSRKSGFHDHEHSEV